MLAVRGLAPSRLDAPALSVVVEGLEAGTRLSEIGGGVEKEGRRRPRFPMGSSGVAAGRFGELGWGAPGHQSSRDLSSSHPSAKTFLNTRQRDGCSQRLTSAVVPRERCNSSESAISRTFYSEPLNLLRYQSMPGLWRLVTADHRRQAMPFKASNQDPESLFLTGVMADHQPNKHSTPPTVPSRSHNPSWLIVLHDPAHRR